MSMHLALGYYRDATGDLWVGLADQLFPVGRDGRLVAARCADSFLRGRAPFTPIGAADVDLHAYKQALAAALSLDELYGRLEEPTGAATVAVLEAYRHLTDLTAGMLATLLMPAEALPDPPVIGGH